MIDDKTAGDIGKVIIVLAGLGVGALALLYGIVKLIGWIRSLFT